MNARAPTRLADPQDTPGFAGPMERPESRLPSVTPQAGEVVLEFQHSVISAQKVAVYRDEGRVMQKMRALAARNGEKYYYSWEVNDRANQRKTTVEGPTIKLANDMAREYGNCIIDIRALDMGDHWMFFARFTDLETGFSMTRPFQQRKAQNTGMKDRDRAMDIVFQIGASKAIRNVVVNSLSSYAEYMVEEAKKALVDWVEKNGEKAVAWIASTAEAHSIDFKRIEAVVGRITSQWTARDKARVMAELRGIDEGLTVADEVYPTAEAAERVTEAKDEKKVEGLKPAAEATPPETANAAQGAPQTQPQAQAQVDTPVDPLDIPANLDRRTKATPTATATPTAPAAKAAAPAAAEPDFGFGA